MYKSATLKLQWSQSLRFTEKRNSPLHHASCLVGWRVFACVCVCFSHLVYVLVHKLHPLEAFVVPQLAVYKLNELPITELFLLGEVGGCLCVCLWVFPPLGSLVGAKQAPHIGSIGGPQVCGENKNENPFLPP